MTIYLTRNTGPIWQRPLPSWKLVVPCETTQLARHAGRRLRLFMAPTGWGLALLVWAYALVSFLIASAIKIAVYRSLTNHPWRQVRHSRRIEGRAAA